MRSSSASTGAGGDGKGGASGPVQSRRAMLEEYRRQKQQQKQQPQQPGTSTNAPAAAAWTTQGLRSKIQGLKTPPPKKPVGGATAQPSSSSSGASSVTAMRPHMAAVDQKKIQDAGDRAVAPGTPVHSLQKRLRMRPPLAADSKEQGQEHKTGETTAGKDDVPLQSKPADMFKKPVTTPTGKGQETDEASADIVAAHPDEGKALAAWVEEATDLARSGFLSAARALLQGLGREHRAKAFYWAARARLEEEQAQDWDQAAALLEEGLMFVARQEVEAAGLRASKQEFLSRRTRAALASVEELLEAEEDELPAPTPRKEKEKAQEDEEDEENVQQPPPTLAVLASPAPRSQQGQGQESAGRRLSTISTVSSSSSSSSVPLIRLTPAAPRSHVQEEGEDKENASQQSSSSPTSTPSSHKPSPASKQRASLTGLSGSPSHRSPSPVKSVPKPLAPFMSPLAGGAVRVPTGSTGKGAGRAPSVFMSPTNILRSGSARRTPTTVAHVEEEEEGEGQTYSVELFAPEPPQQASSPGDYHHGPEEEVDDDDDWAVQGANEWSPSGMQQGGEEEEDGERAAEEEETEKALARMLMPPPSLLPRLSGTPARRSSLSMGAARVLMSKEQQLEQCPPMEMDETSGERKRCVRTPIVSRYPRQKVYSDSLEGLSPGGATLVAAVPRTNPDGSRVYTPVRRSTRLLSSVSSGTKKSATPQHAATPSPLRRDMERLLSDMRPLSLHDE